MIAISTQKGSILILSLVLLVVATILALSSIDNTIMEERMAGNLYRQNIAFQNAESVLRQAESYVMALTKSNKPDPTADGSSGVWTENCLEGLIAGVDCEDLTEIAGNWWKYGDVDTLTTGSLVWSQRDNTSSTGIFKYDNDTANGEAVNGFFVVEYSKPICDSISGGQQSDQRSCSDMYKVTAIGRGPGSQGDVFLRSTVMRRF